jgi:peptidoglycan hydrolase-like amidase
MFVVEVRTDEEQMPVAFHFTGGGWGHGVGMCQVGAIGRAEQGYDYRQILAHYYGGAKVVRLYGKGGQGVIAGEITPGETKDAPDPPEP